jgi:hypothetical protein
MTGRRYLVVRLDITQLTPRQVQDLKDEVADATGALNMQMHTEDRPA